MDLHKNNREHQHLVFTQPNTCPNDYMIPFTDQNPAFGASSSSSSQKIITHPQYLHHLDQFSLNGFTSNPLTYSQNGYLYPFNHSNACGSSKSLALNGSQPIDCHLNNIQSDGLVNDHNASSKKKIDFYDDSLELNPCFRYFNPDDFLVPHEVPCMTGQNGSNKRVRGKKKDIASPMRSGINKKSSGGKTQWTAEEDRHLTLLREGFGENMWVEIADFFPARTGKQCKERWDNHLRPDIKKDVWSEEEVKILIQAHSEIGNKWTEIAKRLPGRTENTIKNYWNSAKRKQFTKVQYKNCKVSPLLLEYIKNLDSEALKIDYRKRRFRNAVPMPAENTAPAVSSSQNVEHQNNDNAVPNFGFGDDLDFNLDEEMFPDIYDLQALLNDPAADSAVDNSLQMGMPMETAPRMLADENNESWIWFR